MVFKSSRKNGSLNHFSPGSPQSMALILPPPCRLTVVDASNDSMLSTLKKRKIDRRWQKSTFLHIVDSILWASQPTPAQLKISAIFPVLLCLAIRSNWGPMNWGGTLRPAHRWLNYQQGPRTTQWPLGSLPTSRIASLPGHWPVTS